MPQTPTPEQAQSWTTWFFESRFTGHIAVGALTWFVVDFVGQTGWLWGQIDRVTLVMGALGMAGLTYACDRLLTRWLSDD